MQEEVKKQYTGKVGDVGGVIEKQLISEKSQRDLFYDYVDRIHEKNEKKRREQEVEVKKLTTEILERLLAEEKMDSHMKCARRRRVTCRDEEVKNVVLKEEAMKDKMVDDYCLLKWVKDYRDRVDEQIHNEVKVRLRECGEC